MNISANYENHVTGYRINTIPSSDFPKEYPLHWHKYVEIIVFPESASSQDEAIIQIDNQNYVMKPGDMLFVWSGELHCTVQNKNKKLWGLQFSPALLYELPDFSPYVHQCKSIHKIAYDEHPETIQHLFAYLNQMIDLEKKQARFLGVEKLILLLEFFMAFSKFTKEQFSDDFDINTAYPPDTLQKIQDSCSYLTENCEKDISLSSAANLAGFSPAYFSRIFKKITGFSFVEYLTLQRIKSAQILLADFHTPITEIAYQCGFSSISTFNRVFRQYLGCSPSEYRKFYDSNQYK